MESICDLRSAQVGDEVFPKELRESVLKPIEKIYDFGDRI
jgi:hypothetical protein